MRKKVNDQTKKKPQKRTRSLGIKVEEQFYWELKKISARERCQMVQLIEMAVELFKKLKEHNIDKVEIEALIEIFERERERESEVENKDKKNS